MPAQAHSRCNLMCATSSACSQKAKRSIVGVLLTHLKPLRHAMETIGDCALSVEETLVGGSSWQVSEVNNRLLSVKGPGQDRECKLHLRVEISVNRQLAPIHTKISRCSQHRVSNESWPLH